ncbi:MAG: asparagine synthase (glutamine-hydrolysing) [Planctomycetota bacterium]|nr:MAG: asparagine synthase (glutamine-hydrolysing) [Planctomycetota bacterium]
MKVDRASMAHGLEVRPPLLDHEFLELCARLPSRFKIHDGETKWLLRELSRKVLPKSIRNRPKQGFEIPIDDWFRGPLAPMFRDTVLSPTSAIADLIDQRTVHGLLESHQRGLGRHGTELWMLLALANWVEQYLPRSSPQRGYVTQPRVASAASYPGLEESNHFNPERVVSSTINDGTPLGYDSMRNT